MKNRRVIIINGMQRGGTNLVWNLLQSHPRIVSPIYETGQVIYPVWMSRGRMGRLGKRCARTLIRRGFGPYLRFADNALYKRKMATISDGENRFRSEEETYTERELNDAVLATKSVGDDVFITPALSAFFGDARCISVVRNGLAVCEGWIRRGASPEKAARAYCRTMDEILRQDRTLDNHMMIRFEDCLANAGDQLTEMCRFVDVDPGEIGKIRIKAKPIVGRDGAHSAGFATEGRKIWISMDEAGDYLDESVTNRQIQNLSDAQKAILMRIAGETMKRLGYEE